jgi:hypothetical protein
MTIPGTALHAPSRARTPIVVGALALSALGLSAPVASAGSNERIDVKYGYVRFESEGDKLVAGDIWGDRRGIRARLGWETKKGPKTASVIDTFAGLESSKHLSIAEGTTVYLQLCYVRGTHDLSCTRVQKAEA